MNELIGTWKLELAQDFVNREWVENFGSSPRDYFSFDSDGHVSVQFMKFPLDPSDGSAARDS